MEQDRLETFTAHLNNAARSITKLKNIRMAEFGLGSTHTTCLRKLYFAESGLTRRQLAEKCELDKAQISRVINELSEKDYVVECPAKTSYRKRITLTDSGREVAHKINGIVLDVNNFVSGDISEDDIQSFYKVFTRICDGLKRAEDIFEQENYSELKKS